jgi:endonuclease III-like uncharacterized protein
LEKDWNSGAESAGAATSQALPSPSDPEEDEAPTSDAHDNKKWRAYSKHSTTSPFPHFPRPTPRDCEEAHRVLHRIHHEAVEEEFKDPNTPETIPHVLDAAIVAVLSQATSWNNAKRAMDSMKATYGSVFAYEAIAAGGPGKLEQTIRCGGLHVRKNQNHHLSPAESPLSLR